MRYLGGKSRIARRLATVINGTIERTGADLYVEPFVGGLAVAPHVRAPRRVVGDACAPLIRTYQAIADGWRPPDFVSESVYHAIRRDPDPDDPLTAFVGFGCSFGGKWFGGYARDRAPKTWKPTSHGAGKASTSYAAASRRSLDRAFARCAGVEFVHRDVFDWPATDLRPGAVWYCDPPYAGTTGYRGVAEWDPGAFWNLARFAARRGAVVFVSEYQAPPDFRVVWSRDVAGVLARGVRDVRTERVFVHRSTCPVAVPPVPVY